MGLVEILLVAVAYLVMGLGVYVGVPLGLYWLGGRVSKGWTLAAEELGLKRSGRYVRPSLAGEIRGLPVSVEVARPRYSMHRRTGASARSNTTFQVDLDGHETVETEAARASLRARLRAAGGDLVGDSAVLVVDGVPMRSSAIVDKLDKLLHLVDGKKLLTAESSSIAQLDRLETAMDAKDRNELLAICGDPETPTWIALEAGRNLLTEHGEDHDVLESVLGTLARADAASAVECVNLVRDLKLRRATNLLGELALRAPPHGALACLKLLDEWDGEHALQCALQAVTSRDPALALAAVEILGKRGTTDHVSALELRVNNKMFGGDVAVEATRAINRIWAREIVVPDKEPVDLADARRQKKGQLSIAPDTDEGQLSIAEAEGSLVLADTDSDC